MKVYVCLLVALLAMSAPAQAILGAKLALLGALKSGIGGGLGGGSGNRGSYLGGYGNGLGYSGGYNYNRPVYTGYSANNGWGHQSYGYGGYSSYNDGYSGGYNGGHEQVIKVIKVIEEPQVNVENYARTSSVSSSSAGWVPVPAPVQTYPSQPVHSVQISAPAPIPVPVQNVQVQPVQVRTPVQTVQISPPAPVPVIQPPQRPVYVSRPVQYQVTQPVYQQPQPLPQVKTVDVIVDAQPQHVPAQTYGPPPPPGPQYVAPYAGGNGAWNSGSWSNFNGNGLSWKNGGIWESIGC